MSRSNMDNLLEFAPLIKESEILCDMIADGMYDDLITEVTTHQYDLLVMYNVINYGRPRREEDSYKNAAIYDVNFCKMFERLIHMFPTVNINTLTLLEVAISCPELVRTVLEYHPELRDCIEMQQLRRLQQTILEYAPGKGAR